jgi:MbtH protein
MKRDDEEDTLTYKVVVNHKEQYSISPLDRENPLGWRDAGCLNDLQPPILAHRNE